MGSQAASWRTAPELRQPLFVAAVLLYAGSKGAQWLAPTLVPTLVRAYLNDGLCLPVMLTLVLWAQRRLGPQGARFVFPGRWVLAAWLYVSLWFEALLPALSARYTADWADVLAYGAGALAFQRWLNRVS